LALLQTQAEPFQALLDAKPFTNQAAEDQAADHNHDLAALQGELQTNQQYGETEADHQGLAHSGGEVAPGPSSDQAASDDGRHVDESSLQNHDVSCDTKICCATEELSMKEIESTSSIARQRPDLISIQRRSSDSMVTSMRKEYQARASSVGFSGGRT
jgi:hypothetical protein